MVSLRTWFLRLDSQSSVLLRCPPLRLTVPSLVEILVVRVRVFSPALTGFPPPPPDPVVVVSSTPRCPRVSHHPPIYVDHGPSSGPGLNFLGSRVHGVSHLLRVPRPREEPHLPLTLTPSSTLQVHVPHPHPRTRPARSTVPRESRPLKTPDEPRHPRGLSGPSPQVYFCRRYAPATLRTPETPTRVSKRSLVQGLDQNGVRPQPRDLDTESHTHVYTHIHTHTYT